jgi:hypothetical protein
MANTLITKNSSTAAAIPTAGQLVQGELAVNVTDKRVFTENSGGTVVELGVNPSSLTLSGGTANGVAYLNGSKALTSGSALTFDGTNLGLGVTPSAWGGYRPLQAGSGASFGGYVGDALSFMGSNTYNDSTNWKYILGGNAAARYQQSAGQHTWYTAPSGTAGAAISFTQAMTLTAAGNVGIGTSAPAAKLSSDVSGASSLCALNLTNSGSGAGAGVGVAINFGLATTNLGSFGKIEVLNQTATIGSNSYMAFSTRGGDVLAERARIDSSGNVGIGTSSPSSLLSGSNTNLTIEGAAGGDIALKRSGGTARLSVGVTSSDTAYVQTSTATSLLFGTSNVERARIDSSGNLLVGRTSTYSDGNIGAPRLQVNGIVGSNAAAAFIANTTGGINLVGFVNPNGTVGTINVTGSATAYNTSSDYRLKNITGPITTSGAYIDRLNPVEGTWKADGSTFVGLIAHEVQEASRTTVATGVKDGEQMQGMDYSNAELIANLIAEVKSLRQRLAAAGI